MVYVFRFYPLAGILDATVYEKVCQRLLERGEARLFNKSGLEFYIYYFPLIL
jgi:hypothetical protein